MIHSHFQNDDDDVDDDKWTTKETNQAIYQFREQDKDEDEEKQKRTRLKVLRRMFSQWFLIYEESIICIRIKSKEPNQPNQYK